MRRTYCICLISFFFLPTSIAAPISPQKRALSPHNPGNGGNNGDQGNTPFPTSNQRQNIVQSRVIRLREQVNRPPELPAGHPIRPYQPAPVRHEGEGRGVFGRILGGGNKKDERGKGRVEEIAEASTSNTKKRKANEMQNDSEAGTSGTKEGPIEHLGPKKQKATAKDVHKYLDTIVEERNKQQKQRNRRYRPPSTRQRENEHWKEIVGGGLAAAGTGIAMVYNTGKKIVKDVKQACIGACRRVDQRIQQHFERQGWSEPSQPVRPGVRRYTPNETPARLGTRQARREELEKKRKKIDQKRLEQKQNSIHQVQERQQTSTRPPHLVRSKSAPPNYEKFSRKPLTRSLSSL